MTRPSGGVPPSRGRGRRDHIDPPLSFGRTGVERERDDGIDPPPDVAAAQGDDPRFVLAASGRLVAKGRTRGGVRLPSVAHPKFRLPKWLADLYESGASAEQVLTALGDRLAAGEANLHVAHRVVNDVGRQLDTDPAAPGSVAPAVNRLVRRHGRFGRPTGGA